MFGKLLFVCCTNVVSLFRDNKIFLILECKVVGVRTRVLERERGERQTDRQTDRGGE